jgi:LL-diaminopimelate aminotransferase
METAQRLVGTDEYYFSQKLREIDYMNQQGKNVINLGIGSPDLPPHQSVIQKLSDEAARPGTHGYQGYKGSPLLRQTMSRFYKTWYEFEPDPNTQVLPLMGSKEGIMHICMAYLGAGDVALVPNPGYPTYTADIKLADAEAVPYDLLEENNYRPDFNLLHEQLKNLKANGKSVKLMFVNYPHMPTGQSASKELFEQLIQFAAKEHLLIVHDNPYSFILNDHPMSILSIPGAINHAIELNSLSKSHNMAGWRVGMLIAHEKRISEIMKFKSNMDSGMFLPVQLAAAEALSLGVDWFDDLNAQYESRRKLAYALLDLLKTTYDKKQVGMFVWAAVPPDMNNGYAMSDKLLKEANVFITPGGIFGSNGNNFIRMSLCSTELKIMESINRIKQLL